MRDLARIRKGDHTLLKHLKGNLGFTQNNLNLSKLIDVEARFKQDIERLEGLGTKAQIRNTGLFYLASDTRLGISH